MASRKSKKSVESQKDPSRRAVRSTDELTPNHLAEPQTAEDLAALQVTCQFLGKTFYEGNTICYRNSEWQCTADGWVRTGNSC
jgi:hypothetical protein